MSLDTCDKLIYLFIGGNYFGGQIPDTIGNLQQLIQLQCTTNQFIGNILCIHFVVFLFWLCVAIPSSICELKNMTGLWLNFNLPNGGLSSTIPPCIGSMTNLIYPKKITGKLARGDGCDSKFYAKSVLKYWTALFLNGNFLTGGIPTELFQLTNLQQLFLGTNLLKSTIPPSIGQLGTTLQVCGKIRPV